MDFKRLEENIIDMIKEEQLKLGYRSETVRLYYPLSSLNSLLSVKLDCGQMLGVLAEFSKAVINTLGAVESSCRNERFCLAISPHGVDYVHSQINSSEFICGFIRIVEKHGCTLDDILEQFHKYSDKVRLEKMSCDDFDYLIYFEDGKPDSYRYCIKNEGQHMIYHRFTVEDYESFGFALP